MTSKLSEAILGKKGKGVIKMNCALVCQVDGQKHTEKHWAQGANSVLEDTSTQDCNLCAELILHLQHFAYFPCVFFLEGRQFSLPTLCKYSH